MVFVGCGVALGSVTAGSVLLFTQLGVGRLVEIELNVLDGRIRIRGRARPQRSKTTALK